MKSIYSLQRPEVIQLRRRPFETLCVSSMQSALLVQCLVERFGLQVFWILLSSVFLLCKGLLETAPIQKYSEFCLKVRAESYYCVRFSFANALRQLCSS